MKKIRFLTTLIPLLLLTACLQRFPRVTSFYISPFNLTAQEGKFYTPLALSPNGEEILVSGRYLTNIMTGEREDLYQRFNIGENITIKHNDLLGNVGYWSFDGRYLGIPAEHYEPTSISTLGSVTYIFDLQENTFQSFEGWSSDFSPFSSNQILRDNGVYNIQDGTTIPFLPDFDFRQEQESGTTYVFNRLWSKKLGIPVAELHTLPYNAPIDSDIEIAVESFNPEAPGNPKYSFPSGFVSKHPNQLAGIFFDPTGEYILVTEWQCYESQISCEIYPFNTDAVYDTVLTLVRWRTQEQQELVRLSEIDPEDVIAYGYMAWSADGSIIFISRKDASPIVLKLK